MFNNNLNLGNCYDKSQAGFFVGRPRLTDIELQGMWESSDIPALIVKDVPDEAFRTSYELEGAIEDPSVLSKIQKDAQTRLSADRVLQEAWQWARLYGGSLVILGARDGRLPNEPLNEATLRGVDFLNVIDRRFITVSRFYEDPMQPNYGRPEIYRVGSISQPLIEIHESRCLRFNGQMPDARRARELHGWGFSVLQRPYDAILKFETGFGSVSNLLLDMSQGVYKLNGLIDTVAMGGMADLLTRMTIMEQTRSTSRAIMIDQEKEDFTRVSTPLAGAPELIDRLMMRVAAAAEMPVSRLFGRSAAGMNATGEGDARNYYASVETRRERELKPVLLRLYYLLCAAGRIPSEDLDIEFGALWTPSELECAQAYQTRATADVAYVTAGVLLPGEVAIARFGDGEEGVSIDVQKRQAEVDADVAFEPPAPPKAAVPDDNNEEPVEPVQAVGGATT